MAQKVKKKITSKTKKASIYKNHSWHHVEEEIIIAGGGLLILIFVAYFLF